MLPDLKIAVIAPNPLARIGLVALLSQLEGCQVVLDTATPADLPARLASLAPEVILWDFTWETESACETLRTLSHAEGLPPVVALLTEDQDSSIIQGAGASGLLAQNSTPDQLYAALLAASHGLIIFDPDFAPPLTNAPINSHAELTPREREVLTLLAQGLANKTIARQLGVSDHTVKFHVNAILNKLGAQSRTDAVVKGARAGLIIL